MPSSSSIMITPSTRAILLAFSLGLLSDTALAQPVTSLLVAPTAPAVAVGGFQRFSAKALLADGSVRFLSPAPPPISASEYNHTCAVQPGGKVACWGYNYFGELGMGAPPPYALNSPGFVSGIEKAIAVSTGMNHSCAALADGTVRCWGANAYGQLGNGTTTQAFTPVAVSNINHAVAVAAGRLHSCALLADGQVRCWGYNYGGQIGADQSGPETCGQYACSTVPVTVPGIFTATAIAIGDLHSCALLADGTVRCWGWNYYGQLGNPSAPQYNPAPVTVQGISTAVAIDAQEHGTCAVLADGGVRCWGSNTAGKLGDGTTQTAFTAVAVQGISNAMGVATGITFTCALLADGTVKCWGNNGYGNLGNGLPGDSLTPVNVIGLSSARAITAGYAHACAVLADGTARCWGYGGYGGLGDGLGTNSRVPVMVKDLALRWDIALPGGGTTTAGPPSWNSGSPTVAAVNQQGLARGLQPGVSAITVSLGPLSANAQLSVGTVFPLTVTPQGDGCGTVTSSDGRITCGTVCGADYSTGALVRLTPSAAPGSVFTGWNGESDCLDGMVTMTGPRNCIAIFADAEQAQVKQMDILRSASATPPTIEFENGHLEFVSMDLPLPSGTPADPVAQALAFLDQYRFLYRLPDPRATLYLKRIRSEPSAHDTGGGTPDPSEHHLFFGQQKDGNPVHGATLAVHIEDNRITGTNGFFLTGLPDFLPPALSVAAAESAALAATPSTSRRVTGKTSLFYFNAGLLDGVATNTPPAAPPTRLAWRVMVRGLRAEDGHAASWRVFIDAMTGEVLQHLDLTMTDAAHKDFDIESAYNTESDTCWALTNVDEQWFDEHGPVDGYPGGPGNYPGGAAEGDGAYLFAHAVYDYFFTTFHRHSFDNDEEEVEDYLHVGAGWNNAEYTPFCDHFKFGDGHAVLDIMAHEFTHGVTSNEADLDYENQSGALNESYSDVFGCMVDNLDWLFGEDEMMQGEDTTAGGTVGGNTVGDNVREAGNQCGNGVDDDGDGVIDEGCPETGRQCGNAADTDGDGILDEGDDDNDGYFDEGCPESGNECGNGIDDDGDGAIDEGCPGSCQDGIDNAGGGAADSSDTDCISRDLSDPTRKNDPDHMNNYVDTNRDNGGVHTNSGIPNKVAYLIAEGGLHYGIPVVGIGRAKTQDLYYSVLKNRLTDTSRFRSQRRLALSQAQRFVNRGLHDFAQDDVCSVRNAFASVGLTTADVDCDGVLDDEDPDSDGDFVPNGEDNCVNIANPFQQDLDGDGIGDACDDDIDGDGVDNAKDNCPLVDNADQANSDALPDGDACQDQDSDGIIDITDNCPLAKNPNQADNDHDGVGNICDDDMDNDGVANAYDNCSITYNPIQGDRDRDGVGDDCDNCPDAPNPNQNEDMDNDGIGDACDNDIDGDGTPNDTDPCPTNALPVIFLAGGPVLPCMNNEDLISVLSGDYGGLIQGGVNFPSLTAALRLPIAPCSDAGCPDWLDESFRTEVNISLPMSFEARIVDERGFTVRKGGFDALQSLRFHPASDSFFRFAEAAAPSAARSVYSAMAATTPSSPPSFQGKQYFLEIYPPPGATTGTTYPFSIRVQSSASGNFADLDGDGDTDGLDLAEFAARLKAGNPPVPPKEFASAFGSQGG